MARCVSPARGHPVPRPRCGASSLRGPAPTVASPAIPVRSGRMDTLEAARQRLRPAGGVRRVDRAGAGSAGASSNTRAAAGPGSVLAEGSPLPSPPWHRGGKKPWRGGGRRGGQCQAGGLAFRCPLLGAGRPRSLGVPRLTAAASRQLLLPALLPAPAPGRCALAFSTEHLDWQRLLPRLEDGSGAGPRRGGVMI